MEIKNKLGLKGELEIYSIPASYGDVSKEPIERIHEIGKLEFKGCNLITNVGYSIVANRITGLSTYASTTLGYFAISDGTVAPSVTRTAADFYADGANWYDKAVTSVEAFSTVTYIQQWNCYLSSTENTVASITKFAMGNADPITSMFNEVKFAAISKDSSKSLYFRYKLTLSEV